MTKKVCIGAITLVIAGLMITSATGIGKPTQLIPATQTKSEPLPVPELKSMNRDAVISKFLNGNGLEKFTAANQVIKKVNALTSHLQRQQISAETIRVDTQNTQAEKKLVPQIMKTRSGITLTNRHPGIADNGEGCFLMVYIEFFENNTRLVICGSNDYGANWGEPVYFGGPEPNNIPAMPSVAYWGKNGTVDRWYITYVDNSIPCGELHIIEVGTDTVTIVDLINAEFESVYWPSPGFCDPREPQIACDSRYGGFPISLSVDISGYNNAPALIYPGGLLGYYSLNNVLGNDISIDAAGHKVFAVWDPIYSTHGHGFLVSWENVTNHNDPSNEVYIWCADDGYQFFYPAGKAYNNHIIMAVEAKNMTAGTPEELDIVKFMDGTTGEIANETSWSWAGRKLLYPEVAHVQGDTFIVTCIAQNNTNPQDVSVLLTVSYDAGVTWSDLFTWSGNDEVKTEYRSIEMPVGGSVLFWEYQYYTESPDDNIVFLHNVPLTVRLQGMVFYPQPFHDRAHPTSVVVENLDPENGGVIPGVTIQTTADYDYFMKLLLGFDIWTNATIKVTASEPYYSGFSMQLYDNIIHPIEDVNIQDVEIGNPQLPPPTQVTDITAWHTDSRDLYKGIGGYPDPRLPPPYDGQSLTYQSTSTETGNLEFIFFWGDGANTTVTSTTGSASATHAYALYGYCIITVKVQRAGQPSTLSNPSPARQVRMYKLGDANADGWVSWRDIDAFVTAMSGKAAYYAAYPTGYFYTCDTNFDHIVNWRDIDPFVALMGT